MFGSFSRAYGRKATKVYSGRGADIVMQSSEILAPLLPGHSGIPRPGAVRPLPRRAAGAPDAANWVPLIIAEETDAARSVFLRRLYNIVYEEPSAVGAAVRAVHRKFHLSFAILRRRSTDVWPALFAKWGFDGATVMEAWREWLARQGEAPA
jgi:hypothetical protein